MNQQWAAVETGWDAGGVIYFGCMGIVILVLMALLIASRRH